MRNKELRPVMVRNTRTLFLRAGLMEQEVQTLHGIVAELSRERGENACKGRDVRSADGDQPKSGGQSD